MPKKQKDCRVDQIPNRGSLINEADLIEALNSGTITGAALDVVSTEPIRDNNPLLKA